MSGAGNDFVVLDGRELTDGVPGAGLATQLCDRRLGIGADGVLIVRPGASGEISAVYRNADGSPADFCGNGARCAARFAVERGLAGPDLRLVFAGTAISARVEQDQVAIEVPRPTLLETIHAGAAELPGPIHRIRAGVEHLVAEESGDPPFPLERVADLAGRRPGEINVTLYRAGAEGRLSIRTLERGSGETLACGSAALAVAALASSGDGAVVTPPAGIPLTVRTPPAPAPFTLVGPARIVFEGEYRLDGQPLDA
jgi:diaminopimelate epimerase